MFAVQEVLYGIAEDFDGNLLYTLDQLSSASLEISSDPTEITDKNGNIIKQIYKSKTGTFTATSALLSPNIINAGSGSDIEKASKSAPIEMPKVSVVKAGDKLDITGYKVGTVKAIGLFGNGANSAAMEAADVTAAISQDTAGTDPIDYFEAPAASTDEDPIQYLVTYMRDVEEGIKMANLANKFPKTVKLTLLVALADPCASEPKAAYVVIPSFQADPSMTISLDSESSEVDFTGALQTSYCSCAKELYEILIPNEDIVVASAC